MTVTDEVLAVVARCLTRYNKVEFTTIERDLADLERMVNKPVGSTCKRLGVTFTSLQLFNNPSVNAAWDKRTGNA